MPEQSGPGSDDATPRSIYKRRPARQRNRGNRPEYFGAVDLGTNNCRLLIARSMPEGFKVVDSFSSVVRLGAGLSTTGRLADKNMDAAIDAMHVCARKLKAKNVRRWRCIATQACRAAENGEEFLARAKSETGLTFETISPRVEARLSVMGVLNIIDMQQDVALVVDIGGGSSELSWVDVRKMREDGGSHRIHRPPISAWASLPIGVVSLSEQFPETPDDLTGWYQAMKDEVFRQIDNAGCRTRFGNVFKDGRGHLVGTSGTITSLAGVHMGLPYYQRDKIDGTWMQSSHAVATARKLASMSLARRQAEPCIGTDRATMLVAGCAIMDVLCELWPSQRIRVADRGLREGMLMGLMNKSQIRKKPNGATVNGGANGA